LPTTVYVITTPEVIETGVQSYAFMFRSGANMEEILDLGDVHFGHIDVIDNGEDRIFNLFLGRATSQSMFMGGVDSTDTHRVAIEEFAKIPSCVLLMDEKFFDWFEALLKEAGVDVKVHHAEKALRTG
jgi:hypothetical protein